MITNDPIRDFNEHDYMQMKWLDSRPECDICKKPIQDEYAYRIEGEVICEDCLNRHYRFFID